MDTQTVVNNAEWFSTYNSEVEINKITQILGSLGVSYSLSWAVDIGCGNGCSVTLLRKLFPAAQIVAIDKFLENINFIHNFTQENNVNYLCQNAFEFFPSDYTFDFVLFSCSLFNMSNVEASGKKYRELKQIIDSVLASVKPGGMILVLQPTKGGTFEKLLSKFIPGSDEDYSITHKFLWEYGFIEPNNVESSKDDLFVIWRGFDYSDEDQLFSGIASVLMLECGGNLKHKIFIRLINEYKIENDLSLNHKIQLTDCVNIYYLIKEN